MPGTKAAASEAGARTLLMWGAGLFFAHIISGYMQEMLFSIKGFTFGFYLTLVRYVVNAVLAFAYLRLFDGSKFRYLHFHFRWMLSRATGGATDRLRWEDKKKDDHDSCDESADEEIGGIGHRSVHEGEDGSLKNNNQPQQQKASPLDAASADAHSAKVPLKYYLLLSFLSVMALGLSTSALAYLNYPTKVILKTSKLVVIMLFSRFLLGKKHTAGEYSMALSMVAGLVLFTLGDYYVMTASPVLEASLESSSSSAGMPDLGDDVDTESFEWRTGKGVLLLFAALIFEAINVNLQKKILVGYEKSSPAELVFYNAFFGSLVTLAIVLVNGEIFDAWEFATTHSVCHYYVLGFALFSSCGVACAIMVLHNFDPMTIGMVVTVRKSITVLTSFILIPKPTTVQHIAGGMLVFVSLFISAVWKSQEGSSRPKDFAMD